MLEPGTQIGKYEILERIGTGGMADVYEAEDIFLGRIVAMKVLPPEFVRDPERVLRFEREVRNLAALDHPNIVTVYDVGQDSGCHYYTMTLLQGGDLKERIHKGLSPDRALDILEQIADALGYAHSKGLIHRDIKPQNILFDQKGRPILTDLGIAKAIGSGTHMTRTGMIMGTPHYMSPEQGRGIPADSRSDLYSLGVVFFEMLTGTVPYEAEDTLAVVLMHVNNPIPKLPAAYSAFQVFIDRLMAKNPDDRFSNSDQLLLAIEKLHQGESFLQPDQTIPASSGGSYYWEDEGMAFYGRKSAKTGRTWLLAGTLSVLIAGAGFYILKNTGLLSSMNLPGLPVKMAVTEPQASSHPINLAPEASNTAQVALQGEIKRLLVLAKKDRQKDRLTSPEGSNAHERYQAVLTLDGKNKEAREGMAWIVNKYISLADSAVGREAFDEAEKYLSEAATVIPDARAIQSARNKLAAARDAKAERDRIAAEKAATAEKEKIAARNAALAKQKDIDARNAAIAEKERIAAQKTEEARRAAFENQLAAGMQAIEDKEKEKAILAFRSALALYPDDSLAQASLERAEAMVVLPNHGDTFRNSFRMTFVFVAPGVFTMGSSPSEIGRDADERQHTVTLSRGYWLQTTEVTQAQWQAVMGSNPSRFKNCGENCPVENISWGDIQIFLRKLNSEDERAAYRLPTEAEWEYAARAGGMSRYCFGEQTATLNEFGWYDLNAGGKIHAVMQKRANAWGLYDMYGNVWEWCHDWYGPYPQSEVSDPTGPLSGSSRVLRGGSWFSNAQMCRSAVRHSLAQDNRNFYLGFRVAASQ